MATTPASRKQKGRKLQNEVRQKLLETFSDLHPDNLKCALMSEAGEDIKMSPLASKHIPYSIECKNTEKIAIWQAIEQAKENTKEGTEPVVVFRRNNSETYVVLKFEHFLKLISPLDKPTSIS